MALSSSSTLVTPLAGGRDTGAADQGNFFVAITPTPGTGVISNASVTAFTETTPYLVLYNGGNLNIYPTHVRLHTTVVGAGSSTANWTWTLDTGNRLSSGGTGLTIANTNMTSNVKSGAIATVGAVTATAASSVRRVVGHQMVKFALETVHDCLQFNFGGPEQLDPTSLINNAATLSHTTVNYAPLVIGPGQSLVAVRWAASHTTGVTYEVEMGWIEK